MRYFYYAFCKFSEVVFGTLLLFKGSFLHIAQKLSEEIRFPVLRGHVCRALPYEKDLTKMLDMNTSLFIKGFNSKWTHMDLFNLFKEFGGIVTCKVSLGENHVSRGYGFVQFESDAYATKAIESVRVFKNVNLLQLDGKELEDSKGPLKVLKFEKKSERST